MRDMTDIELHRLRRGLCPICRAGPLQYLAGPRGGMSRNIETVCCGVRLNVIDPDCETWLPFGQVIDDPETVPTVPPTREEAIRDGLRTRLSRVPGLRWLSHWRET